MGLFSGIKKLGKALIGAVGDVIGFILSPLLPDVPNLPKSIEARGKTYKAELRFNEPRLGDVKPVVYGRCRVWFAYVSMPYTEFVAHNQVLNAYLHVSVGEADLGSLNIGDTPASTFSGIEFEVLPPGEDMTLIRPNVYTNPEVEGGIDLLGGALTESDPYNVITVAVTDDDGGTLTFVAGGGVIYPGFITSSLDGFFQEFHLQDTVIVFDCGTQNGQYIIASISDDQRTLTVFPSPPGGTTQTDFGVFVAKRVEGPYWGCPPGTTIESGAFDIAFAALRDHAQTNDVRTVEVVLQYRPGDDAGNILDETWAEQTFTFSDNIAKARRYTQEFTIDTPGRYQFRLWRKTYEQNDSDDPSSAAQWVGLKGYPIPNVADSPASDATCTRLAIRVEASGKLSGQSSKQVNGLVQRKLPIYNGSTWSAPTATSNPIWALIDWVTTQSNGNISYANLDLPKFLTLATFCTSNGDTFDAEFDREVSLWDGGKTILRVCRARPVRDNLTRLIYPYRDEPTDPTSILCDGVNATFGQDQISLPDADTITGVQISFIEPLLWIERDGPLVGTSEDVRKVKVMGFTTWTKAWQEAQYELRDLLYRNQSVSVDTEMEGLLPRLGDRAILASANKSWGQAGEIVAATGLQLEVFPPMIWTSGLQHFIYLQGPDGVPGAKINCEMGAVPYKLVLDSAADVTLRTGEGFRTAFAFGHDGDEDALIPPDAPRIAILQPRKPNGLRNGSSNFIFDHPFVHEDPGPAPDDPYTLGGSIPDLTITGLTAEANFSGIILDEAGEPILDEDGEFLLDEEGTAGVTITVDWADVAGTSYYSLRWKIVGVPGWHAGYTGIASTATFGVTENGDYQIRVKAISGTYVGNESVVYITISGIP